MMSDLLNIQIPLKTVLLPQNSLLYTQNVHIECEQTCVTTDQSHIIIHLGPVELVGKEVNCPPPPHFGRINSKTCPSKILFSIDCPPDFHTFRWLFHTLVGVFYFL